VSEKNKAMQDLNYMGISAGALLPGLDMTVSDTVIESLAQFDNDWEGLKLQVLLTSRFSA